MSSVSAALTAFGQDGLRSGRPYQSLVTYNTWFAYGTAVDETTMRSEIDGAARLGAELFVLDAGWYIGAGRGGVSDFSSGLGTWEADPVRFPHGLGALSDYAHSRGIKFGIWVEPERVAQSTLNRAGLARETWTAKAGGKYGSVDTAQICLGSAAARQWVLDELVRLIDTVRPDYLKWDNNLWVNCDRSGHDHGATDGNFAHVRGLYGLLSSIRARYPDMLIENVSGGGNRLDLEMLRYSDVGWMDDRSAPSLHVRHIVEGLTAVFPPAYLLSFVMEDRDESLHQARDLALIFRSRMLGALGLSFRTGEFDDDETAAIIREIQLFKETSGKLAGASGALLSAQASGRGDPPWDVYQVSSPHGDVMVAAFQTDPSSDSITVVPHGIVSRAVYEVRSSDAVLGTVTGADLRADGITIVGSPISAAHWLVLTRIR
jgi:alpha-galactosidase